MRLAAHVDKGAVMHQQGRDLASVYFNAVLNVELLVRVIPGECNVDIGHFLEVFPLRAVQKVLLLVAETEKKKILLADLFFNLQLRRPVI